MGAGFRKFQRRLAIGLCSAGMLFQFGSCQFQDVQVVQTVNGRDLLINLVRVAIITPIDQAITGAIMNAFPDDDN